MDTQPLVNQSIEMNPESVKNVVISDADKERFFKSILADKPYEEVFQLFDGQIKVRFRSITVQENTDVVNQIVADRKNGVAADNDAYFITITAYRLGLALVSIDDVEYSTITKDTFSPMTEKDTYILGRSKLLLSWSTPKLSMFIDAFQQFEKKLVTLTAEVQTPNFWKAST
jgi:hypothetical protein